MPRIPIIALSFTASLALAALVAAGAEPRWQTLNRAAGQAAQAKDYARLRQILRELKPLMPGSPRIAYNLAASNAALGDALEALAGLRNLAAMGLVYDLAVDPDFSPLLKSREFAGVIQSMDDNKKAVSHSS